MERVSDEWLDDMIKMHEVLQYNERTKEILPALKELRAWRRGEITQSNTNPKTDTKNSIEGLGKRERAILPLPCTKWGGEWTVKNWMQKLNEEVDEFKIEILCCTAGLNEVAKELDSEDRKYIAEESADVITVMTSMLERFGIDEGMRQEAQEVVNAKNLDRGRL